MNGWVGWVVSCGTVGMVCVLLTFRSWRNLVQNWRNFTSYELVDIVDFEIVGNSTKTTYNMDYPQYHRLRTWLIWVLIHPIIFVYLFFGGVFYGIPTVFICMILCENMGLFSEEKYFQWTIPVVFVIIYLIGVESVVDMFMNMQASRERRRGYNPSYGISIKHQGIIELLFTRLFSGLSRKGK